MFKHTFRALLVACVAAGTLLAAKDPFVGKWKLDQSKSKITGEQIKIKDLGANKYTITFGNISDTLVANGTDQPVHFGRTESITKEGPNVWKTVTKKNGRVLWHDTWTLVSNGRMLTVSVAGTRPDGTAFHNHAVLRRMAGTRGFAGTWESTKLRIGEPEELDIRANGGNGLSFAMPAEHETLSFKFDGKDYPDVGPNVPAGSTSSSHRVNQQTLQMTDKIKGAIMDTAEFKLSSDLKTMTITVHETGQSHPLAIVYDRE